MGAGRFSLGGLQRVEAFPPLVCETLALGRSFSLVTDFIDLDPLSLEESLLVVENTIYGLLSIDTFSAAVAGGAIAGAPGTDFAVLFRALLNPTEHNAPAELTAVALNQAEDRIQGFKGNAFQHDGSNTAGPVDGALVGTVSLSRGSTLPPLNTGIILKKGDVFVISGVNEGILTPVSVSLQVHVLDV
jgi:hypothetical protein